MIRKLTNLAYEMGKDGGQACGHGHVAHGFWVRDGHTAQAEGPGLYVPAFAFS
jgi:hypothetical protein